MGDYEKRFADREDVIYKRMDSGWAFFRDDYHEGRRDRDLNGKNAFALNGSVRRFNLERRGCVAGMWVRGLYAAFVVADRCCSGGHPGQPGSVRWQSERLHDRAEAAVHYAHLG
jgi:hypothetical protein